MQTNDGLRVYNPQYILYKENINMICVINKEMIRKEIILDIFLFFFN